MCQSSPLLIRCLWSFPPSCRLSFVLFLFKAFSVGPYNTGQYESRISRTSRCFGSQSICMHAPCKTQVYICMYLHLCTRSIFRTLPAATITCLPQSQVLAMPRPSLVAAASQAQPGASTWELSQGPPGEGVAGASLKLCEPARNIHNVFQLIKAHLFSLGASFVPHQRN